MARLSRPPARLSAPAPRFGPADRKAAERERERKRRAENEARRLYNTAAWRRLRLEVLDRDDWTCRQTGVLLTSEPNRPNSATVDHIEPHRGDPDLFWDPGNLQSVAKSWHDRDKQRIERRRAAGVLPDRRQ